MQRPERVSDWTDFLPFGLMSDYRSRPSNTRCSQSKTTEWIPIGGHDTGYTVSDLGVRLAAPALSLEVAVRNLSEWQRRYLPGIHTPPGKAVLAHLIETWSGQTSFTNLRKSTGFSETTIRHALNQFVALGLVEIHKDQFSSRQRGIAATPKLKERLEEYATLISRVIALHESR